MKVSRNITRDRGSVVPLRVDYLAESTAGPTSTIYCTDIEGTEVRVANKKRANTDLSVETGEWYRFDGMTRAGSPGDDLLFPSSDSSVEHIDAPETDPHPPLSELDAPWLVQLAASDELVAVTVQPRPTDPAEGINIEDPETFEIGAVCLTHCDRSGETAVYHREESDTHDERLLLDHVVEDLSAGATLVTRGASHAPLELLYQRLAVAASGEVLPTGAERVLEECYHATAERVANRVGADTAVDVARERGIEGEPVLLSDYDIGVDPADWREGWTGDTTALTDISDPRMTDSDYTALVERYLGVEDGPVDSAQVARCLKDYASADLDLLHGLVTDGVMDRQGCPRLSGRLEQK